MHRKGPKGRIFAVYPTTACYALTSHQKNALPPQVIQDLSTISDLNKDVLFRTQIPARDAVAFKVPAGGILRLSVTHGPQVADLNVWNASNPSERFYSSKTRQIHSTHLSTGDSLWSCFPYVRPLLTILADTVAYGFDDDSAGVHDVIGSRCDPYTHKFMTGETVNDTCHSNLVRAVKPFGLSESDVHDVLNVFMCTGFTQNGVYFTKPSPARKGDYVEFFAHVDSLVAISACRQGDVGIACGDLKKEPVCYPLGVEVYTVPMQHIADYLPPQPSSYDGNHGIKE